MKIVMMMKVMTSCDFADLARLRLTMLMLFHEWYEARYIYVYIYVYRLPESRPTLGACIPPQPRPNSLEMLLYYLSWPLFYLSWVYYHDNKPVYIWMDLSTLPIPFVCSHKDSLYVVRISGVVFRLLE